MAAYRYYSIYKPFGMLSQFSPEGDKATLKDLGANFPTDVYPVGRLDADSEGLLLLTNDKSLNHRLLSPKFKHWRTYWAQVEGIPSDEALLQLSSGVDIKINKKIYHTLPAKASLLEVPSNLPERNPPIRFRKSVPDTWISLSLIEGKNRQVRKMTAAVGHPTLRLIRHSIEGISLGELAPGEVMEWRRDTLQRKLFDQ